MDAGLSGRKATKLLKQGSRTKKNYQQTHTPRERFGGCRSVVAVGPYCRHGRCRSRTPVKAADHDLHPEAKLVPLGILEVD